MLNSASRTRSDVGRVASPGGACSRLPRQSPAMIRIGADILATWTLPVSTLCDVDKALPVLDPAIRPLTRARMGGPAFTVVADGRVPLDAVGDR